MCTWKCIPLAVATMAVWGSSSFAGPTASPVSAAGLDTIYLFTGNETNAAGYRAMWGSAHSLLGLGGTAVPAVAGIVPGDDAVGPFSSSARLDGADWYSLGNAESGSSSTTRQFTIDIWFKSPTNMSEYACLINSYQEASIFIKWDGNIRCYFREEDVATKVNGNQVNHDTSGLDLRDGEWHQLTWTVDYLADTPVSTIYVDGPNPRSSLSLTPGCQLRNMQGQGYAADIQIGWHKDNGQYLSGGLIDCIHMRTGVHPPPARATVVAIR